MPNLGSLYYELFLKDLTDQDLQAVEKKLKNLGIELDTKKLTESLKKSVESYKGKDLALGVKTQYLHDAIRAALKQPEFPIKVTVNKAEAQDAVREALRKAGLQQGFTASDKRQFDAETRRLAAMQVAQARAAAQNALAQQRLARAHNIAESSERKHTSATISLNSALKGNITLSRELGSAIGAAYSVVALKNFMTKVVEIGGELEQQKLAMKAILGDEGMANTISSQINTLAVKSPFGIMELNQYAKQLTAFQIPYNELYDTMKRMADVSAAVGVDMGRIILAYGQVRAAKFLKGTELRQFTEANIPLIDMLAERFTKLKGEIVSAGDIMDMISNKEVSFEDVKAVLWELTGEGGRFYNMQEVLSESVKAKWKNLADALDLMFADIADSTSGPLKWTAEMLTTLAASWEKIGAVLAANIAIFGSYKVTQLALNRAIGIGVTNTLKSAQSLKQKAAETLRLEALTRKLTDKEKALIATSQKLTAADYVNLASTKQLTKQKALLLIGLRRLDANSIGHIAKILNISKAEIKAAQSTKKWILQAKLLSTSLKNAFVSIGSAILNPMTAVMAAVSAGTYLWQRHSEQASQAKEFGDNMFTAAVEQGKNLREIIKGIGTDIQNLDETALRQAFERLSTAIKDYAPNGEKVLLESKFDAEGNRRKLDQQVSYLDEYLKRMEQAAALAEKIQIDTIVESATKANSGVFDDAWKKDIADLAEQYTAQTGYITQFAQKYRSKMREIVDTAINVDKGFATASEGMKTYEEKFKYLAVNITRYTDAMDAVYQEHAQKSSKRQQDILFERFMPSGRLADAENEAMKEAREFFEALVVGIEQAGVDIKSDAGKGLVEFASKSIFDEFKILAPQYQDQLRNLFNEVTGLEFDDTFLRQQVSDKLMNLISEAGGKLAEKIRNGEELTDAEQELLDKIKSQAVKTVGDELPADLKTKLDGFAADNVWWLKIFAAFEPEQIITDWQKAMFETFGNNPEIVTVIKSAADPASALRAIAELRDEAQSRLDKNFLILGIKPQFTPLDTENITDPVAKKVAENINKDLSTTNAANNQTEYNLNAFGRQGGGSGTPKDEFAEAVKERISLLKKAKSEYESLAKSVGREAASKELADSPIFAGLKANKFLPEQAIPKTLDEYEKTLDELQEKLTAKGLKTKKHRVLNVEIEQVKFDIKKARIDEQLNKTKEKIDATIKDLTRKWDFHKQLFELTGDRETSVKLAFGEDVAWQTQSQMLESILNTQLAEKGLDVPLTISDEEAKEKLKGTPLYDLLWKPTKEAKLKEEVDLQINVAKAVADAASIADKIKVQMGLREADETMLRSSKKEDGTEYSETEIAAYLKKYDDRIEELKSSMLELLPIWEQIFGDHQYQSYGQIQAASDIAKQIIDNAKINKDANGKPVSFTSVYTDAEGNEQQIMGKISQLEKLRKAIQDLYKEGLKKNPFATLWENLKKVFNGDWKDKNATEKLALIGESAAESAQLVGNLAGQLAEMFEAAGHDDAAQAMTDVQDVMNTVSNIGKGFAEGGLVGGIAAAAGEAIGWVTKAFQASARHKEALRAIMNETLAQQREYNLLLMQQNLEYKKAATILGEDTYGKAKNAVKVMKDAYKDLQDELAGTAEQQGNEQRKANSSRMFARMFGLGFDEAKAKLRQAYAGLADIEVKTGHKKTGLFGLGKGKDIYSSILDVYPDLIDANGKFNSSLAETIINTRVMSDEDKAALQNMIDLAEQAEAAYEELNSYMTDIFGELGSSMTDALVSAFANGSDAAEDFYDSVSDMLEALAKQMIYSVTLAPYIEKAQKKMMDIMQDDAMSDEQKFGAWTGILDGLLDDALKQQGVANDLFKKYQDMAAEKGFDIFKPDEDSKSGLSAGIQSVTEDTADLLASYINQIRADVAMQTGTYWTRLLDDALPQMNVIAQSQLDTQRQIAENTLRNAVAAEAIQVSTAKLVELNDQMGRSWRRIAERNWGYS